MDTIHEVLNTNINWLIVKEGERFFECDIFPKDMCYLRLNDFPEEPLWTLFYNNESVDFDDTPVNWKIKYKRC